MSVSERYPTLLNHFLSAVIHIQKSKCPREIYIVYYAWNHNVMHYDITTESFLHGNLSDFHELQGKYSVPDELLLLT